MSAMELQQLPSDTPDRDSVAGSAAAASRPAVSPEMSGGESPVRAGGLAEVTGHDRDAGQVLAAASVRARRSTARYMDPEQMESLLAAVRAAGPSVPRTCRTRALEIAVSGPWLALQVAAVAADVASMFMIGTSRVHVGAAVLVSIVYCMDIALRIYGFTCAVFFSKSKVLNWVDFLLVVTTTVFTLVGVLEFSKPSHRYGRSIVRLPRLIRVARMIRTTAAAGRTGRTCCSCMRRKTGENKRRFVSLEHDFDLDLVYVTDRLLGMSVPAAGLITSFYRNPLNEVVRFFETYHAEHYKVVNLCPELPYPSAAFKTGEVTKFDVKDHMPPLFEDILSFLRVAHAWLEADHRNVLAVHCRGGKGRTGSLCCAWLMYKGLNAEDALYHFALRRTDLPKGRRLKMQGVETPSQVRYLEYLDELLTSQGRCPRPTMAPQPVKVRLTQLRAIDVFVSGRGSAAIATRSSRPLVATVHAAKSPSAPESPTSSCGELEAAIPGSCCSRSPASGETWRQLCVSPKAVDLWDLGGVEVEGDVRISVFVPMKDLEEDSVGSSSALQRRGSARRRNLLGGTSKAGKEPGCLFYFLVHTAFLQGEELEIPIPDVDKACKKPAKYSPDGSLLLSFSRVSGGV